MVLQYTRCIRWGTLMISKLLKDSPKLLNRHSAVEYWSRKCILRLDSTLEITYKSSDAIYQFKKEKEIIIQLFRCNWERFDVFLSSGNRFVAGNKLDCTVPKNFHYWMITLILWEKQQMLTEPINWKIKRNHAFKDRH